MVEQITPENCKRIANAALRRYAQIYLDIQSEFRAAVDGFGLEWEPEGEAFDPEERARRLARLAERGVAVANDGKSICKGWISPSCVACRTGVGTETFLASTQCPRNCYFCFNPNQADYEFYLDHVHDMAAELQQRYDAGVRHTDLAVTGGEPLLHRAELMEFLQRAALLCPDARVRLYTSGAGLDEAFARELAEAGLDEVRFSVKLDEGAASVAYVLERIRICVALGMDTMVEMPVMPDQAEQMKELLVQLDAAGCKGINLLELCFPLRNAEEFARRGYRLRAHPYRVLYDYWYAGGLPIAGSEQACLDVLEWTVDQGLSMGVHYCSLENKLTGQVYQQNRFIPAKHPRHEMDERDYFLKTAKVFGADCKRAQRILRAQGVGSFAFDKQYESLEFPPSAVSLLAVEAPDMPVAICLAVAEMRDGAPALREVALQLTTPATCCE